MKQGIANDSVKTRKSQKALEVGKLLQSFEKNDNDKKKSNNIYRVKTEKNGKKKNANQQHDSISDTIGMIAMKKKVCSLQIRQSSQQSNLLQIANIRKETELLAANPNNDSMVFEQNNDHFHQIGPADFRELQSRQSQDYTTQHQNKRKSTNNVQEIQLFSQQQDLLQRMIALRADQHSKKDQPSFYTSPPMRGGVKSNVSSDSLVSGKSKKTQILVEESKESSPTNINLEQQINDILSSQKSSRQSYMNYKPDWSPDIIITRPPEEMIEENVQTTINSTRHNTLQMEQKELKEESDKGFKIDGKVRLRIKKNSKNGEFILEFVEDNGERTTRNLKLTKKKNSGTIDKKSNNSDAKNTARDSERKSPSKRLKGRGTMSNIQKMIINQILKPMAAQKKSKRRRRSTNDELVSGVNNGSKKTQSEDKHDSILQVSRLKTLAEVDEDDEKSVQDNQNFGTIDMQSQRTIVFRKSKDTPPQQENKTDKSETIGNESEKNSKIPGFYLISESQSFKKSHQKTPKDMQKNLKSKTIDKKHEPINLDHFYQQQTSISKSKNIISQVRQKNQEMLKKEEEEQKKTIQQTNERRKSKEANDKNEIDQKAVKKKLAEDKEKLIRMQRTQTGGRIANEISQNIFKDDVAGIVACHKFNIRQTTQPRILLNSQTQLLDSKTQQVIEGLDTSNPQDLVKPHDSHAIIKTSGDRAKLQALINEFIHRQKDDDTEQKNQKSITMQIRFAQHGSSSVQSSRDNETIRDYSNTDSDSALDFEEEYDIEYDDEEEVDYESEGYTEYSKQQIENKDLTKQDQQPAASQKTQNSQNSIQHQKSKISFESSAVNPRKLSAVTENPKSPPEPEQTLQNEEPKQLESKNSVYSSENFSKNVSKLKAQQEKSSTVTKEEKKETPVVATRRILNVHGNTQHTLIPPNELMLRSKSYDQKKDEEKSKTIENKITLKLQEDIQVPKTPMVKPLSLLTPENLDKLESSSQRHGPRSITTNSVISGRKNGRKKINQYQIYNIVGQGKFSKVYRCVNEKDGQTYAIKIVNKKKLNRAFNINKKQAYNFVETEMAILKKLDHPNVLRLFEVIDDSSKDKLYLVTDFIKNGSLAERIQKNPLTTQEIRNYFRQLVSALLYCHDCAQIIHRDIKPENILIDDNDLVKLADFGVSTIMENGDDMITTKAGTNFYFSPQLCKGPPFKGKPADVWACAVVLFFMATKRMPFMSQNLQELYAKIQDDEPDYSDIEDPRLLDLLKQMLLKSDEKRITLDQIRQHPWVTDNGHMPLECAPKEKLVVNEKDLKSVITRVVMMKRIIGRFKSHTSNQIDGPSPSARSQMPPENSFQ